MIASDDGHAPGWWLPLEGGLLCNCAAGPLHEGTVVACTTASTTHAVDAKSFGPFCVLLSVVVTRRTHFGEIGVARSGPYMCTDAHTACGGVWWYSVGATWFIGVYKI
jgi:hypothetical protein